MCGLDFLWLVLYWIWLWLHEGLRTYRQILSDRVRVSEASESASKEVKDYPEHMDNRQRMSTTKKYQISIDNNIEIGKR